MKKILAAAATAALLMGSAAQASSAQSLSLKNAPRASTVAGESNEAVGGFLIPLIAVIAVIGGILIISDDSDSN